MTATLGTDEFAALLHEDITAFTDGGGLVTDRTRSAHTVASVLVATQDGRVLLARNRQGWGTVGGHVEPEDGSLRAAVVRELREEAGLAVDTALLVPLSVNVDCAEFRPGCRHVDFCFVVVLASAPIARAGSDVMETAWYPIDATPAVNEHMRRHLDALRRYVSGDGIGSSA